MNKKLGSCPHCGGNIWSEDIFKYEKGCPIYICLICRKEVHESQIIPF